MKRLRGKNVKILNENLQAFEAVHHHYRKLWKFKENVEKNGRKSLQNIRISNSFWKKSKSQIRFNKILKEFLVFFY